MTRATTLSIALTALAALAASCQQAPPAGATCTRASDCDAPLVCAIGRCRAGCVTSADCPSAARCLRDPRSDVGACSLDVDGCATHDCALGFACIDDECRNVCGDALACPDRVCVAGACVPIRGDAGIVPADAGATDASGDAGPACSGAGCDRVIVALGAGTSHVCAVAASGALWCWGSAGRGQLGDGLTTHSDCPTCASSPVRALDENGQPVQDATRVTGTNDTTCAVRAGRLWCWGGDVLEPTEVRADVGGTPAPLDGVREVRGALESFCVIAGASREVWCAGDNASSQLGDGTTTSSTLLVRAIELGSDADAISGSQRHFMALVAGTVRGVGNNDAWELGVASDAVQPTAVVPSFPPATALETSGTHTCSISAGGTELGCWGQIGPMLGPGASGSPCAVSSAPGCSAERHVLALPAGVTFAGLTLAREAVCAWTPAGEVWCAGDHPVLLGATSRLARVPELSGIVDMVATDGAVCALDRAGAVWCWGTEAEGQLGNGHHDAVTVAVAARVVFP